MILTDLRDERFKVGVLLAPVGVLFSDKDSLSKVVAPVLLYRAQNDRELAYPYHVEVISKSLAKSSTWLKELELQDAEHFAFITSFPDFLKKKSVPLLTIPQVLTETWHIPNLMQRLLCFWIKP